MTSSNKREHTTGGTLEKKTGEENWRRKLEKKTGAKTGAKTGEEPLERNEEIIILEKKH
mgnify:CR=1 FL=1